MRRFKYTIISAFCLTLSVSCESLLKETPKTFIAPETFYTSEEQFNGAVWGCFEYLMSSNAYGNVYSSLTESLYYPKCLAAATLCHSYNYQPSSTEFDAIWIAFYQCIGAANSIINLIENGNADLSDEARDCFLGEVLFYRALSYFNLVRGFGGVPIVTEPITDINGVITPRASIKDVYEKVIIPDLLKAIELLPVKNPYDVGRAHKISAAGILSKVYCTMAGFPLNDTARWQDAKDLLITIVNPSNPATSLPPYENGLQADMADLYYYCSKMDRQQTPAIIEKAAVENGIESVFEINYSQNPTYNQTGWCNFPNTNAFTQWANTAAWIVAEKATTTELGEEFPDYMFFLTKNDPRKYISFTTKEVDYTLGAANIQIKVPKVFTGEVMTFDNNWTVMRYAELILLLAEAENELNGPTDLAIGCVNAIRKRARTSTPRTLPEGQKIDSKYPYSVSPEQAADKDTFRHYIKKEVVCEFIFEGVLYYDFVRWHELEELLIWSRDAFTNGNAMTRIWPGDHVYFWPIPQIQINATNNILTQNDGY